MDCKTELIDYADTGYFSPLILDYLKEDPKLRPFYKYPPNNPDFQEAIHARKTFPTNRTLLVNEIKNIYRDIKQDKKVIVNIELLADENTFTICTAHQPNLFTGYLYFIYKILHAIKLASFLKKQYPQYNFVPVYYMGSEDNDLEELGTVHIDGKTFQWQTSQTGAVGRMQPENIEPLINEITKHLGINDHAREIITWLKEAYLQHKDIQTATLYLVNALFGKYGLVVVNADSLGFKRAILPVLKEELFQESSFKIVNKTIDKLLLHYHAQASPREINLFYLNEQIRERIIKKDDVWQVLNTNKTFTREQLEQELNAHPERFSPNVILRGILQETILPDIAFIGGGGELSYWMELKGVFEHYNVPFPLLMLRSSVLWVDEKSVRRLQKVDLKPKDLFTDTESLISDFVKKHAMDKLVLKEEYQQIETIYQGLEKKAENIDITLKASVGAERKKALCSIGKLEHKFLRAEKKKFAWQTELIRKVKNKLFPNNNLQERVENILPFYAVYGPDFIDKVYFELDPLNPGFTLIQCHYAPFSG